MATSAYWWNSTVSASMAFRAWMETCSSCFLPDSCRCRAISTCFLCSWLSFRAAKPLASISSCSCLSKTLHHSPRKTAVSASSARSRCRFAAFRWIWAARLFWMSSPQRRCASPFARRLASSEASFSATCFSTRSSSSFCISDRRLDCASIMRFRCACFSWKTSSSFAFLKCNIFSFLTAYSWIFSSSLCCLKASSALICFRYSFAFCVSCMAFTACVRRPCSALRSPSRSSMALRRRSSPSSIWSSISLYLFSLYSAS
mmetsp:Transcript_82915/g.211008  ORF Transcript_82915/g.211008 Transcript_82915/m.211008 type:complete len:259 (-) Transcript_82915:561-1337(-)